MTETGKSQYVFYGWEQATMHAVTDEYPGIRTPQDLYDVLVPEIIKTLNYVEVISGICEVHDILSNLWCAETCTSRLRASWSPENKTLGQCSITSFLVQDIFGGTVYGIPRDNGMVHCYNVVDGRTFDLTSEQFGGEVLDYTDHPEQSREVHFANAEKLARYTLLREKLKAYCHR